MGAKEAHPKMLLALGENSTPMALIMPERLAKTDPFKQIDEFIGNGPMHFVGSEWVPGAKAVFEKSHRVDHHAIPRLRRLRCRMARWTGGRIRTLLPFGPVAWEATFLSTKYRCSRTRHAGVSYRGRCKSCDRACDGP
jgi:hypothetical protein